MPTSKRITSSVNSLTISVCGLANAAGRVSTQVVQADGSTTFKYPPFILCHYRFRTGGSAPTAGNTVQFFLVRGASGAAGNHIDANLALTDTGYTSGSSPFTASQIRDQLQMLAAQPVLASTSTDYYGSFLIADPGPRWSLYVYNDTGQTLDGTSSNFYIRYEEVSGDLS